MIQLKNSGANVFFNITTPKFAAQAIKKAAEIGWKPAHYINNVSASIGTVMKPAGFENAQDIITAYYSRTRPTRSFRTTRIWWSGRPSCRSTIPVGNLLDSTNAYGYAVASLMHIVLKQCGDDLTRANVMKQAASLKDVQLPLLLVASRSTPARGLLSNPVGALQRFEGENWDLFGDILSNESASN